MVALYVLRVSVAKQALNGKVATLDPDGLCCVDGIENHCSTIGRRYNYSWVIGRRAWAGTRLECSVEEFVEVLKLVRWQQHFGHVELMEVDEGLNLRCRCRVVIFPSLLETERLEELANYQWLALFN